MLAQACTHAHQARASRRNARRTCTLLGTLRVPICSAFFLATILAPLTIPTVSTLAFLISLPAPWEVSRLCVHARRR